jgi:hypothetical protein
MGLRPLTTVTFENSSTATMMVPAYVSRDS